MRHPWFNDNNKSNSNNITIFSKMIKDKSKKSPWMLHYKEFCVQSLWDDAIRTMGEQTELPQECIFKNAFPNQNTLSSKPQWKLTG